MQNYEEKRKVGYICIFLICLAVACIISQDIIIDIVLKIAILITFLRSGSLIFKKYIQSLLK